MKCVRRNHSCALIQHQAAVACVVVLDETRKPVPVDRTIMFKSCKDDNGQMKTIKEGRYVVAALAKEDNSAK